MYTETQHLARRLAGAAVAGALLLGAPALAPSLVPVAKAEPDADLDRLTDQVEAGLRTNPNDDDTDDDGLVDGKEHFEIHTDPLKADTDGDGLDDQFEWAWGLKPLNPDTDSDGRPDGQEINEKTDPLNGPTLRPIPKRTPQPPAPGRPNDRDSDGLLDDDETNVYGTNPDVADTDGDGPDDGQEVYDGTDPLTPN